MRSKTKRSLRITIFLRIFANFRDIMSNAVHRLLIHGPEIIKLADFPPGVLSEEAQETANKDYKNYRLNHFRKCGRQETNEDVLHYFLAASDPIINQLRPSSKSKEGGGTHTEGVSSFLSTPRE